MEFWHFEFQIVWNSCLTVVLPLASRCSGTHLNSSLNAQKVLFKCHKQDVRVECECTSGHRDRAQGYWTRQGKLQLQAGDSAQGDRRDPAQWPGCLA
ncbi:hypothetical protein B484DRAFT_458934 [Ochromonadaceae sp. CCMP2298]|nr:hypothetical protein B484DRAFT_458934 [Ochromonadaceae sp. CCMP2298]